MDDRTDAIRRQHGSGDRTSSVLDLGHAELPAPSTHSFGERFFGRFHSGEVGEVGAQAQPLFLASGPERD